MVKKLLILGCDIFTKLLFVYSGFLVLEIVRKNYSLFEWHLMRNFGLMISLPFGLLSLLATIVSKNKRLFRDWILGNILLVFSYAVAKLIIDILKL